MTVMQLSDPESTSTRRHVLMPCEIYQAWQAARQDADDAFDDWCTSPVDRKAEAYAVYCAAADRENAATDMWLAT